MTVEQRRGSFWRRFRSLAQGLGDGLGYALFIFAILLAAISVWAAFVNVLSSGWKSDAAAWVQAAGSIAAIVGAAWLAQSQVRRARKVRREQYEEAAWYVRFAIKQAQFESHIIAAELVNRTNPILESDVREWRQRATTSATGLNALVGRTDQIHPAVTQVVSNAKVLVDDLINDLALLARSVEKRKQPTDDLVGCIVAPHRALLELLDLYDERMRGVRNALDEGNDMLPLKNWASWGKAPINTPGEGQ